MFTDRTDAGRRLAGVLLDRLDPGVRADAVVLGLPRGGVPVAYEVAVALGAPLDVIVVRKLGVPVQPELAMGAIGEDGVEIRNEDVLRHGGIGEAALAPVRDRERRVLDEAVRRLRAGRARVPLAGRTAVLVDDGIATGSTARAACEVARAHGARRVVLAVPVAPAETVRALREVADEVFCAAEPVPFHAVGQWYHDFTPVSDERVAELLARAPAVP